MAMQVKARVDARNALETYCYNMKQTIEDKLGDKLDEDDKEKVRAFPSWLAVPAPAAGLHAACSSPLMTSKLGFPLAVNSIALCMQPD